MSFLHTSSTHTHTVHLHSCVNVFSTGGEKREGAGEHSNEPFHAIEKNLLERGAHNATCRLRLSVEFAAVAATAFEPS